jgi:hypothetical protein
MDYPIFIKYFLAILPFVVLIYVLFLAGSTKKEPPKKKLEQPPKDSGWVYLLERDGYIKVGHAKYFDAEGKPNEQSFINRMNQYVSDTSQPNIHNVNIFYYNFLPSAGEWDNNIKNLLLGNAVQLSSVTDYTKLKGAGFTCKEGEEDMFILQNIFNNSENINQNQSTEADSVLTQIKINQTSENLKKVSENIQRSHNHQSSSGTEKLDFPNLDMSETNPYFDKIYKHNGHEWFKINDYNHKEDSIRKLFEILDIMRLKGDNINEIISKTNQQIFDTPRLFLSKMPK